MTSSSAGRAAIYPLLLALVILAAACASAKPKALLDYHPQRLQQGQGAVLMHVINHQSLVASRWLKIDDPAQKQSLTVFHSPQRGSVDDRSQYDLVTVAPGTYAVYALYADCPEGRRRLDQENGAEQIIPEISTDLGLTLWDYRLRAGSEYGWWPGIGIGVGAGRHWGGGAIGVGFGGYGGGYDRNVTSSCALFSPAVDKRGRPLIASLTVKPGEIVYAGELTFNYLPNSNCQSSGDWVHHGSMIKRCGAARIEVAVENAFQETARPFLIKTVGAGEAQKAVIRLATPGVLANTARDVN